MRAGRPRTCECGTCRKCRHREREARRYAQMTPGERRALYERQNPKKRRVAERERYRRNPERRKAQAVRYAHGHPEAIRAAQRRWARANPEKVRAYAIVKRAIRSGKLVRGSCELEGQDCRGKVHAHHEDYSKPLDVRWLCEAHHGLTRRL